jgi:hypothetical protein
MKAAGAFNGLPRELRTRDNMPNRSATKKKKGCHGSRMTALEPSLVVKVAAGSSGEIGDGGASSTDLTLWGFSVPDSLSVAIERASVAP